MNEQVSFELLERRMRESLAQSKNWDSLDFLVDEFGFRKVHESEYPPSLIVVDYEGIVNKRNVLAICYYYTTDVGIITTRTIIKEKDNDVPLIDFNS